MLRWMMLLDPGSIGPDDLERVGREAEQTLARLADVQERLAAIRGSGTAADGHVVVSADSSGRIDKIQLNPRAMRLASQDLADELLRAVNAAQDDCARQARELLAGAGVGEVVDEAAFAAMERRLEEAHTSFVKEMERYGRS
ncbi:YbaB/EbfC family DNA-binding protein [Nonomuraea terrae]|uniref:YbaB/EbfC family DNA-binding protein n=2 Tax=Nonomuraea terrae TaxID=2530383 RepID=A0A4V2YM12_9ACTN|nr:YbaB/EbfC family DNA-binding protein [Nonomuraea terrae]